jgi:hypothetical protein
LTGYYQATDWVLLCGLVEVTTWGQVPSLQLNDVAQPACLGSTTAIQWYRRPMPREAITPFEPRPSFLPAALGLIHGNGAWPLWLTLHWQQLLVHLGEIVVRFLMVYCSVFVEVDHRRHVFTQISGLSLAAMVPPQQPHKHHHDDGANADATTTTSNSTTAPEVTVGRGYVSRSFLFEATSTGRRSSTPLACQWPHRHWMQWAVASRNTVGLWLSIFYPQQGPTPPPPPPALTKAQRKFLARAQAPLLELLLRAPTAQAYSPPAAQQASFGSRDAAWWLQQSSEHRSRYLQHLMRQVVAASTVVEQAMTFLGLLLPPALLPPENHHHLHQLVVDYLTLPRDSQLHGARLLPGFKLKVMLWLGDVGHLQQRPQVEARAELLLKWLLQQVVAPWVQLHYHVTPGTGGGGPFVARE